MTGGTRLARVRPVRLAAIDVGSNSVHVVVADVSTDGRVEVVDRVKEMVRLGRRTFTTGRLPPAAMDLAVGAVKTFARLAHARRVVRMRAVATSAVREARNGMAFVRRLRRETGLPVKVITGAEEARDRKSTRLNSSHGYISYAVFCLKKKKGCNRSLQTVHNCFQSRDHAPTHG